MDDGSVLGADFWTTVKAVSPVVGAFVTVATVYLRMAIRDENNRQRDGMMLEIRQLFALKETIAVQLTEINRRLDRLDAFIERAREKEYAKP